MIGAYSEVSADMREVDLITRKSTWIADREYWPGIGSDEYLDVVKYGSNWYRCTVHHLSATTFTADINAGRWKAISWLESVATSLLMSENAIIEFLQNNELRIQKADGTITAGASGKGEGADGIRFWAGSADPATAPYRVNENGGLVAEDADITGRLVAKENSQIAGMEVIGNSLRGVQAMFGQHYFLLTQDADRQIIVRNIQRQHTYIFSLAFELKNHIRLPSVQDLSLKKLGQYNFELTIIADIINAWPLVISCNDATVIFMNGVETFSISMSKGEVLKLMYHNNAYYVSMHTKIL